MNILVTLPLDDEQKQWIEQAGKGQIIRYMAKPDEDTIRNSDIILGNIPLKWCKKQ